MPFIVKQWAFHAVLFSSLSFATGKVMGENTSTGKIVSEMIREEVLDMSAL